MDNLENRDNQTRETEEKQVQYYADGHFSNDPEPAAERQTEKKPKKKNIIMFTKLETYVLCHI